MWFVPQFTRIQYTFVAASQLILFSDKRYRTWETHLSRVADITLCLVSHRVKRFFGILIDLLLPESRRNLPGSYSYWKSRRNRGRQNTAWQHGLHKVQASDENATRTMMGHHYSTDFEIYSFVPIIAELTLKSNNITVPFCLFQKIISLTLFLLECPYGIVKQKFQF